MENAKGRQNDAVKVAAFQEWNNSWTSPGNEKLSDHRALADPEHWKTANIVKEVTAGRKRITYRNTPSNIHRNLSWAQSSIAVHLKSEHFGLNSYLHQRKVLKVISPKFQCRYPAQNVKNLVPACLQWAMERGEVLRKANDTSFTATMNRPDGMERITNWVLAKGWFEQSKFTSEFGFLRCKYYSYMCLHGPMGQLNGLMK